MTVKVPDKAKVKGAGTSAIVDLVGFREDNVLPVAAFYGRGDTAINYLAKVRAPREPIMMHASEYTFNDATWITHSALK